MSRQSLETPVTSQCRGLRSRVRCPKGRLHIRTKSAWHSPGSGPYEPAAWRRHLVRPFRWPSGRWALAMRLR
jgi:hypothetical protein